jgi:hypothetical protein
MPLVLSGIALLIWQAGFAGAGRIPGVNLGPPLILRLEGVLETTPEAARGAGIDVVSMQVLGGDDTRLRYLGATDARTIGGDNALFGKDVLAIVAPFAPNLLLTGPPAMLERIEQLPPHSHVVLEGLVNRGGRTYYLRKVEVPVEEKSSSRPALRRLTRRGCATRSAHRSTPAACRA